MPLRPLHRAALLATSAVLPAPAWAAPGPLPVWVAYLLFVVAAILVIALLLREALFDGVADDQPLRDDTASRTSPPRYDVRKAARKTAANRRVA
jgi:hypothetical protein